MVYMLTSLILRNISWNRWTFSGPTKGTIILPHHACQAFFLCMFLKLTGEHMKHSSIVFHKIHLSYNWHVRYNFLYSDDSWIYIYSPFQHLITSIVFTFIVIILSIYKCKTCDAFVKVLFSFSLNKMKGLSTILLVSLFKIVFIYTYMYIILLLY